ATCPRKSRHRHRRQRITNAHRLTFWPGLPQHQFRKLNERQTFQYLGQSICRHSFNWYINYLHRLTIYYRLPNQIHPSMEVFC
ncbi:MAG: hypothetical protein ACK53Y_04495, partial [bacterium]